MDATDGLQVFFSPSPLPSPSSSTNRRRLPPHHKSSGAIRRWQPFDVRRQRSVCNRIFFLILSSLSLPFPVVICHCRRRDCLNIQSADGWVSGRATRARCTTEVTNFRGLLLATALPLSVGWRIIGWIVLSVGAITKCTYGEKAAKNAPRRKNVIRPKDSIFQYKVYRVFHESCLQ